MASSKVRYTICFRKQIQPIRQGSATLEILVSIPQAAHSKEQWGPCWNKHNRARSKHQDRKLVPRHNFGPKMRPPRPRQLLVSSLSSFWKVMLASRSQDDLRENDLKKGINITNPSEMTRLQRVVMATSVHPLIQDNTHTHTHKQITQGRRCKAH